MIMHLTENQDKAINKYLNNLVNSPTPPPPFFFLLAFSTCEQLQVQLNKELVLFCFLHPFSKEIPKCLSLSMLLMFYIIVILLALEHQLFSPRLMAFTRLHLLWFWGTGGWRCLKHFQLGRRVGSVFESTCSCKGPRSIPSTWGEIGHFLRHLRVCVVPMCRQSTHE